MQSKPKAKESRSLKNANLQTSDLTSDVRAFISSLGNRPEEIYLKDQAFSKFVGPDTDPPKLLKERAISKWLAQEEVNAETNVRLAFTPEDYHILPRVRYSTFFAFLTELISSTIGDVPPDHCLLGGFSGGASTSRNRTKGAPALKFTGQAHVTARAEELFLREDLPLWSYYVLPDEYLVRYDSNHMFTVPKNSVIDRCACKEPDINMYLQKGLGDQIRRALRRVGINLNDQSINRRLARQGSITGDLATIDLSSASDSVTWELVFQALPSAWFTLLDSTRSETTLVGGEVHTCEMFSSMGNGFTFELESLLFWAIARTVSYFRGISGTISVYGDDIIVPSGLAEDLMWVLSYLGFRVNAEKSFWEGPFRESCGGHYYNGRDITPFYIRRPVDSLVEVINLANNVRKWSGQDGHAVLDHTMLPLWEYLQDFVPEYLRGGVTLGSPTQLVDLSEPKFRLSPISKDLDHGLGGYLHWHSSSWQRDQAPECIGFNDHLSIVANYNRNSSAPLVLAWTRIRSVGYSVASAIETSNPIETDTVYRLRRPRKRLDVVPVVPWVVNPGRPDELWI